MTWDLINFGQFIWNSLHTFSAKDKYSFISASVVGMCQQLGSWSCIGRVAAWGVFRTDPRVIPGRIAHLTLNITYTVKPVLSGHSKIDKTKVLKTNGSLMKVESIAECSLGAFCNTLDLH